MARALETQMPVLDAPVSLEGIRGRALERRLLLWNVPLVVLAAWGISQAQRHPSEAFAPALTALGAIWLACFALHILLALTRFDGDLLLLPITSLLFTVGGAYHLDLNGTLVAGLGENLYLRAVFVAIVVLALVTTGGRYFKRLSVLFEEKVWWRVAGDRPYYESVPFHLLLVGLMLFLSLLLVARGMRAANGALIQVRLPGGIQFTPSELIRLAVAFFLADYLGRNSRILRNLRQPLGRFWPLNWLYLERRAELGVVLLMVGLYCFFFYAFRDFGPAAVVIVLTLATLYAATGRVLTPLLLGLAIAVIVAVPTWKDLAFHTLRDRVEMWFNPWDTSFPNGDHQARILWSIASGGWFGMGVGTQNLPHTLPLARNDAAFAGVAATMGMWTGLAVLALFAALTWRGMIAARQAPTDRMRLLGFCLTALLAFQAVWICGAMVRVFPFTGINVPFISTGLTSMIASALALGTIWNVSRPVRGTPDATESTPEVLTGITRLGPPIAASFALPAAGLILYGCPWILGDRTMVKDALGRDRNRDRMAFSNPYLDRFKRLFPRGRIFSADGRLLAASNPGPQEIAAIRQLAPNLAAQAEKAQDRGDDGARYYPLRASGAQLIGWNSEGRFAAKEGSVETACDGLLRGYQPSQLPFFFRNRNNPLVHRPQQQDLVLTIDADLQQYASQRLAEAVKEWGGRGGALVVYDVSNGAVLAAATAPSFDPNGLTVDRMAEYARRHPRNGILTNKPLARDALYFPGSSFKILTAAAALEEGVRGSALCRNGHNASPITWQYKGKRWKRDVGQVSDYAGATHGDLGFQSGMDYAFTVSCNVFFGTLAAELGPERLQRAMSQAELFRVPDVDELAEHLPYSGFGQIDVKTSPLEMAMLAGAAAAARPDLPGATAARPHWVQAVQVGADKRRDPEGIPGAPERKPYRPFPPEVGTRLREMMVRVVEDASGTAHAAFFRGGEKRLPGITVGGKTGTAEFEKRADGRTRIGRHAWFVGFARSDHEIQPRTLAFAVLVEDVRAGGTGGHVCAPVARDMIARILPLPGQSSHVGAGAFEQFYNQHVRPTPFGRIVDWLQQLGNRTNGR